jgi:hypothetical protein
MMAVVEQEEEGERKRIAALKTRRLEVEGDASIENPAKRFVDEGVYSFDDILWGWSEAV